MPVMWPGVITTGLFSFLLAYNDYLVCALLLDAQSQTMVPAITQYFNRETTTTDQIEASGEHEVLNWFCLLGAMEALGRKPDKATFIETWALVSPVVFAHYNA